MTDNLTTIFTNAIDRVIGSLPTDPVDDALAHTLALTRLPVPPPSSTSST
jgi:hypothetical protein